MAEDAERRVGYFGDQLPLIRAILQGMANTQADTFPEHKEDFEVVMCARGISPNGAATKDFKRVRVTSASSWAARFDQKVEAEKDHVAFSVVKPGIWTQEELLAREREMFQANPPIDRVNI